jgi:hypothetical protein
MAWPHIEQAFAPRCKITNERRQLPSTLVTRRFLGGSNERLAGTKARVDTGHIR